MLQKKINLSLNVCQDKWYQSDYRLMLKKIKLNLNLCSDKWYQSALMFAAVISTISGPVPWPNLYTPFLVSFKSQFYGQYH